MAALTTGAPGERNIMVVDDNPANLMLLEGMLSSRGHEVHSFPLGRLALAAATRNPPDLILLDINMPEMNGYQVCERLKASRVLASIPVIFLSALNDVQDKVKAFQAGAADFISKPFQFDEVHARVDMHLKMHGLQRALQQQNEHLEEVVAARTRELTEANERLTILDRSKNEFLNLISHEFRTPLNGILGAGELILDEMPSTEANHELREMFEQSRRRILAILDDALLLSQIDVNGGQFRRAPVSLHAALTRAMEQTTEFAESRSVGFSPPSVVLGLVLGEEDLLVRALQALLETAVRFSEQGKAVRLAEEACRDSLRLMIESEGRSIPDSILPRFFDLFAMGEDSTPGKDVGMGPALAYRILALLGASVSVANRNPAGIGFTVSLRQGQPPV